MLRSLVGSEMCIRDRVWTRLASSKHGWLNRPDNQVVGYLLGDRGGPPGIFPWGIPLGYPLGDPQRVHRYRPGESPLGIPGVTPRGITLGYPPGVCTIYKYFVQYILYILYKCTIYILQYILYNIYCTMYTVQYILCNMYCANGFKGGNCSGTPPPCRVEMKVSPCKMYTSP